MSTWMSWKLDLDIFQPSVFAQYFRTRNSNRKQPGGRAGCLPTCLLACLPACLLACLPACLPLPGQAEPWLGHDPILARLDQAILEVVAGNHFVSFRFVRFVRLVAYSLSTSPFGLFPFPFGLAQLSLSPCATWCFPLQPCENEVNRKCF